MTNSTAKEDFVNDVEDVSFNRIDVAFNTPVLDLLSITSRVPLLKRKIKVQFFGENHGVCCCDAMFDGGAVCSFMQQTVLKKEIRELIKKFLDGGCKLNPLGLRAELITIKGATSATTELCAVVTLKVQIEDWVGEHEFIISDKLDDKEIILGRDFLRKNHVIIDHGKDNITLKFINY